ncbi:hypothetical protein QJ48_01430 [Paenibacillus sp. A3]|nr:hypothetical protein QJ48_01430 [Paenibacillus sp. A3]
MGFSDVMDEQEPEVITQPVNQDGAHISNQPLEKQGATVTQQKLNKNGPTVIQQPIIEINNRIITSVTKGKVIVGSKYNEIRPTQENINPEKVEQYAQMLLKGQEVPAIVVYKGTDGNTYLEEGHHRFVASKLTNISVPIIERATSGPSGLKDWSEVQWKKYINEDQFWGD